MDGAATPTRLVLLGLFAALAVAPSALGAAASGPTEIAAIDLSKPFAARSPWRFTADQAPPIEDPIGGGDAVPGPIRLCLRQRPAGPCDPQLNGALGRSDGDGPFAGPHFLNIARLVRGAADQPLLLVQTASIHSGDGDQLVYTQALAYRRAEDRFVRVYEHQTGHNNSQEVRFIETGPLKGDFIAAEPTRDAPFGFWIVVSAPAGTAGYRQVLRYRSATRYSDGNPLAVIDSDMPNIEQRLGVWRPGSPLPLPPGPCARPHLVRAELWCS